MKQHIHIFGASGSGTTTIAQQICDRLGYTHFDSDDFYWLPTAQPFTVERPREECLKTMHNALTQNDKWILSGSLCGWAEELIPYFDLVVFVYVPQELRLKRLKAREEARYGEQIAPGGGRYEASRKFLEWAAAYDAGTQTGRNLAKHEEWLKTIEAPVLKVINQDLEESIGQVLAKMNE